MFDFLKGSNQQFSLTRAHIYNFYLENLFPDQFDEGPFCKGKAALRFESNLLLQSQYTYRQTTKAFQGKILNYRFNERIFHFHFYRFSVKMVTKIFFVLGKWSFPYAQIPALIACHISEGTQKTQLEAITFTNSNIYKLLFQRKLQNYLFYIMGHD